MDEPDIQVVLVNIKYDKKGLPDNGEFPISALEEAKQSDYPESIELGEWKDGGRLLFKPHLKANFENRTANADIAIKIGGKIKSDIKNVITDAGDIYQKYIKDEEYVYYVPPRKWKENPLRRGNYQESVISHYVTVGSEKINIIMQNKIESMLLISQKKYDLYKDMMNDLMMINQQLIMDNTSSMSMAVNWSKNLYDETNSEVEDFCRKFRNLEKYAKPQLQQMQVKMPYQKIKKITSKTLIDKSVLHKQKVRTISYIETLDTFEHQIIKSYAKRLNKNINLRKRLEEIALKNEKERLENSVNLSEEEIEKIEQERRNDVSIKLSQPRDIHTQTEWVYIQIRVVQNEEKCFSFRTENSRWKMILEGRNARECKYRVYTNYYGKWYMSGWKEYKENECDTPTQYVKVTIPMENIESAAFAYGMIDSSNAIVKPGNVIGIYGEVDKNYYLGKTGEYSKYDFNFIKIEEIDIFKTDVYGKPLDEIAAQKYIKDLTEKEMAAFKNELTEFLIYPANDDNGFVLQNKENIRQIHLIESELADKNREGKWDSLQRKIDDILGKTFLSNVQDINTRIEPTNLFLFDPYYNSIYEMITKHENKFGTVDYVIEDIEDADHFPVMKLSGLYETWCFIKILMTFVVDYKFKIIEVDGEYKEYQSTDILLLRQMVADILEYKDNLSGSKIVMESDIESAPGAYKKKMTVTLWYENELSINKDLLISENLFAQRPAKKRCPDYFMKINYAGKDRLFVFDAKDRSGEKYDGISDLCGVAFQKYMIELGYGLKLEGELENMNLPSKEEMISGSFIIHSCDETEDKLTNIEYGIKSEYDPKRYLGAQPDVWEKAWIKHLYQQHDKINSNYLKNLNSNLVKWASWRQQQCDNHENKIGIVEMTPKNNNFPYIIQMIMEQQFNLYKNRCWICGGKVSIVKKSTGSNKMGNAYYKYHIKCLNPECGELTVETHCANKDCKSHGKLQLGKHQKNYYATAVKNRSEAATWNVVCPVCRQTAAAINKLPIGLPEPAPF